VEPADGERVAVAGSGDGSTLFRYFATARFELDGDPQARVLYWLEGYGGGGPTAAAPS
jgi:hypothetical protein